METQGLDRMQWGGRLWVVALVAIVLTIAVVLAIFPRSLAYVAPTPTPPPWTQEPGLFNIPTVSPTLELVPTLAITPAP